MKQNFESVSPQIINYHIQLVHNHAYTHLGPELISNLKIQRCLIQNSICASVSGVKQIDSQTFFKFSWKQDTSIESMLTLLVIEREIYATSGLYFSNESL